MALGITTMEAGELAWSLALAALSEELRRAYDTRPVSRAEWDAAAGEEA